ncbi:Ctr copper transporter [Phaeosphaeria sp. MPI-PUGE-AT-0046c]|nr:Ctr copper transporter [Phaeosphaeria sp. MPI-PUGE-AT-0046c]
MAMTFFTSTTTPLYSTSWTPTTTGQYAGTCIFLITLAAIFRALLAVRLNLIPILAAFGRQRAGRNMYPFAETSKVAAPRPWRADEAVTLGFMDVVLGGIGYLLMIAVMTMNVGYFLSVLGGIFIGSLIFGRFMAYSAAH